MPAIQRVAELLEGKGLRIVSGRRSIPYIYGSSKPLRMA